MSGRTDFRPWEELFGIQLTEPQKAAVESYLRRLQKWSRAVNVTGRRTVADWLRYDFFESFWAGDHFLHGAERLVDVGSGAGFPGLAIKIRRPELPVVLIEPNVKKLVFLKETARGLALEGVEFFDGRGEDFEGWKDGDLACLRALRPSRELIWTLNNLGLPILSLHGAEAAPSLGARDETVRVLVPGSEQRYASLFQ